MTIGTSTPRDFEAELSRLVSKFEQGLTTYKTSAYDEAALRNDFLNPFWRSLGWDLENRLALPQSLREVELETRVEVGGRKKRADYIFRTDGVERFVCEAKKPKQDLSSRDAYQVQRYAFNLKVYIAVLTDFEQFQVFVVGGKPDAQVPFDPIENWHFRAFPTVVRQLWDLFARQSVAAGSLDQYVRSLPKRPMKGKPRQGWLIKPERTRTVDAEFLAYIEDQRKELARDIVRENKRYRWDESNLNEAVQRILDRILFIRISEDRDIDTGRTLERIVEDWRQVSHGRPPLFSWLVGHFRALDEPFNGALFHKHFSESLRVSDQFLLNLIGDLSSEDSPYLFSTLPVEILGSVYERFIGQVVRVTRGKNVKVEPKPEVRKAGGVYYTPRDIVDYIVNHTVGKLLEDKDPIEVAELKILDPACGSGSFLIRAFERVCQHYIGWFQRHPKQQDKRDCYCDPQGNLRLTTHRKRRILLDNIFGVDLDQQAVEVTLLSLYLKILEGETRASLAYQQGLFPKESFLPDLSANIRLGNSLIEGDYFDLFSDGDERLRVKPFDWRVEFREILDQGGFDAVVGNPPYVRPHRVPPDTKQYLWRNFSSYAAKSDILNCFLERGISVCRDGGYVGMITSDTWRILDSSKALREFLLASCAVRHLRLLPVGVFQNVAVKPVVVILRKEGDSHSRRDAKVVVANEAGRSFSVPQERWLANTAKVFDTDDPEAARLKKKIETNSVPFGEIVTVDFGLKTANDSRFIRPRKRSRWDKPLIASAGVGRYILDWDGSYVWYRPDLMTKGKSTARPGEPDRFERDKLVISRMAHGLVATLDERKFYIKDALLAGLPRNGYDLRFLLGLLNSRALNFWYLSTFTSVDTHRNELMRLPIPKLDLSRSTDKDRHDGIVKLVDRMLDLMPRVQKAKTDAERQTMEPAVRATDQAIDKLVYELFQMTQEEISLVEESFSGKPPRSG